MRLFSILFAFYFTSNFSKGQTFEGRIMYSASYQYKNTGKQDSAMLYDLGSKEEFIIKKGDYLIKSNGKKKEWTLYKSQTNKLYEKYRNNDTLYVIDAGVNNNTILEKFHVKKGAYTKDFTWSEYVFETKDNGQEYFYYNKKYRMDKALFANHKQGHLGDFVTLTGCIPLIRNYDIEGNNCEKRSYQFIPESLEDKIFEVPTNLILKAK